METHKNKYRQDIVDAVEHLKKFSDVILNPPIEEGLITKFEKEFGIKLPNDYKFLLSLSNEICLIGEIHGINVPQSDDLGRCYIFYHFYIEYPTPLHLIPFSPDGFGNYYCFDTSAITNDGYSCKIVFWVHDCIYDETVEIEVVYECLCDFINEVLIDWYLDDTNYDGSDK